MNKTGAKLEFAVGSKRYLDSGCGGLPLMIHCDKTKTEREISVIPVERPNEDCVANWWENSSNGKLVLKPSSITDVEWSEKIALDAAGTSGQIHCKRFIFNVSIESLAGSFYRSCGWSREKSFLFFTPRSTGQQP